MTDEQFIKFLKKPNWFQIIMNYIICISTVFGGLLFLNMFFRSLTPVNKDVLPFFGAIFLLSIGSYGFWRISRDYKVVKIGSNLSLEEKKRIIDEYILVVKGKQYTMTENIAKFQYRNKYWNSIDIHVAIDEDSFLLNAKSTGSSGFIDFGLSRRSLNRLQAFFKKAT